MHKYSYHTTKQSPRLSSKGVLVVNTSLCPPARFARATARRVGGVARITSACT